MNKMQIYFKYLHFDNISPLLFSLNTRETTWVVARSCNPGLNRSSRRTRRLARNTFGVRWYGEFSTRPRRRHFCTISQMMVLACQRRSINSWTRSVLRPTLLWNSLCDLFQSDWDVDRHFKSLLAATPGAEVRPNTVLPLHFRSNSPRQVQLWWFSTSAGTQHSRQARSHCAIRCERGPTQ